MGDTEIFSVETVTELFPQFAEIPQAPSSLFMRGSLEGIKNKKIIAIVGARAHTSYGTQVCRDIVYGLSGYPVVIVSGLALGIDAIAHKTALDVGLTTIAFPGSGLGEKVLYPAQHRGLAEDIISHGGALLSEFPNNFKATPWSFPKRNRLVAGIADLVLVIEAKEKSGALITARLGTEYNKIVCAVPGSVYNDASGGTNWLLRLGAVPVRTARDILEELGLVDTEFSTPRELPLINEDEQKVLTLLTEPRTKDFIIETLSLDPGTAHMIFSTLEIKGLIKETYGMIESIA